MTLAIAVAPGSSVDLDEIDARGEASVSKDDALARLERLTDQISELQDLLYAAGQHAVLIILQGMDTSGKDGTIRSVFRAVEPLGCRTWAFKVPTPLELAHDFLWRVHHRVPERGMMTIFNRSHYEDVLVVRVKGLAPESVWRPRYEHINAFERLLADNRTLVLKFFLYISKEEQERRLLAREEKVDKAWKLNVGDWIDRESWDAFMEAYEDALSRCSTPEAPWYIVPADRKWYRDLCVAEVIVEAMQARESEWRASLEELGAVRLAELQAYRSAASSSDDD